MERSRRAADASDDGKFEGTGAGKSIHLDQQGQRCLRISGSKAVEGGRGVEHGSDEEEQEGAGARTSKHVDRHG